MCDAMESCDTDYLIVPKEETLDDLVIPDHCGEDDVDAVILKEELSDTCPRLDDDFNEQNVGMVMPIKTELILCDNIAQLRRQHESAEHGSVSDKDVFTGNKAAEINQEQRKDSSMHAACVATSDVPMLKKCMQSQWRRTAEKQIFFFCKDCKKLFQCRSALIIHMRSHTREKPYLCDLCQKKYMHSSSLKDHMRTHTGEKPYSCAVCQKKFTRSGRLLLHMRTHTGEKPYCCTVCQKLFSQKGDLTKHMRIHTGEKPYSCDICQRKFTQKYNLIKHMRTHTGEKPLFRDQCEIKYASKTPLIIKNLRTHVENFGSSAEIQKLFFCNVCKKQFKRKSSLIVHMGTHTGERPYVCDLCQNNFSQKSCLRRHMKIHAGEKAHSCDLCQKKFMQKCNLTKHMRTHTACDSKNASRTPIKKNLRTHAEENFGSPNEKQKLFFCKISCVTCKKQFKCRSDLMIHMKAHTEEKPFSCELCQNKFTSSSGLLMHMGTHTSEKPFSIDLCENKYSSKNPLKMNNLKRESIKKNEKLKLFFCKVCKKQFQCRSSLIIHMRTHTGEKPYLCDLCQKNFSQKACLRRHMTIHAGENPHSCDLCLKKFRQKYNLGKHMRSHTACENKNASRTPLIMENLRTHAEENFDSPDKKQKLFFCKISCVTCKKQFKCRSDLMIHNMKSHTGEKPFSCELCQNKFTSSSGLLMHMRTHTGEKPYVCDLCQKNFSQKADLRRHMTVHMGEKAHSYDPCQKKIMQKYNLTKHISAHLEKKLYSCNLCERKFPSTNILLMHTHKTHAEEKLGFPAEKDKLFPCNVCNKQFVCKSALDIHIRTHIGEKPYFCDLCQEKFESSNLLFMHNLETHTEETFGSSAEKDKVFPCNVCEKRFIWRSALDTHMRIHTADKPYSCDLRKNEIASRNVLIMPNLGTHVEDKFCHSTAKQEIFPCNVCERQFIWRSALDNHMWTHIGEIIYSSGLSQVSFTHT